MSEPNKEPSKADLVYDMIAEGMSNPMIRDQLSINNDYLKKIRQRYNRDNPDAQRHSDGTLPTSGGCVAKKKVSPLSDVGETKIETDFEVSDGEFWKNQYNVVSRKYKSLLGDNTVTLRLVQDIKDMAPMSYKSAAPVKTKSVRGSSTSPQSAVLLFSDTHIGKRCHRDQTLGFGHYDMQAFLDRLQVMERTTAGILTEHVNCEVDELVIIMMGDMLDGNLPHGSELDQHVTKFGQYYAGGHAIAQMLRNLASQFPKVRIETVVGNHCVDTDTEILTKRGWLRHDEVRTTDMCLGLKSDGKTACWQPVKEVVREKQVDRMVSIRNREFDFRGTEHHRFYYKIPGHPMLNEARWSDIKSLPIHVPSAGYVDQELNESVPDADIELCAWVLTDGSINKKRSRVSVRQSEDSRALERSLKQTGLSYSVSTRERESTAFISGVVLKPVICVDECFYFKADDSRTFLARTGLEQGTIPAWAWNMTTSQFRRFLDALILGDGTRRGKAATLYGKSKEWLSEVQSLCVAHGVRATLSPYQSAHSKQWRLCVVEDELVRKVGNQTHIETTESTGEEVWCVRTGTENFMCRRNGISYFTGNTRNENQKKMPTKNRFSNLDMFLYAYCEALTADIDNIEWNLNMEPFQYFTVKNSVFFAAHGDHLRGGDRALGIPSHALGRQLSNMCQMLGKRGDVNPDYYCFGHFHREMTLPHAKGKIFINGAFPGADEYAMSQNFASPDPEQKLLLIHPKHKMTANWPIYLGHAKEGSSAYVVPREFI